MYEVEPLVMYYSLLLPREFSPSLNFAFLDIRRYSIVLLMKATFTTPPGFLHPSNPELDCPARKAPKGATTIQINDETKVFQYEEVRNNIVASVGPIACNFCDIKCTDAYVAITDRKTLRKIIKNGCEIIETNVDIKELAKKPKPKSKSADTSTKEPDSVPLFGARKSGEKQMPVRTDDFGGWKAKTMNQIADDALALHDATSVITNRDGSLELHEFFQHEITFGPQATAAQPATPVEVFDVNPDVCIRDPDGQHRLF